MCAKHVDIALADDRCALGDRRRDTRWGCRRGPGSGRPRAPGGEERYWPRRTRCAVKGDTTTGKTNIMTAIGTPVPLAPLQRDRPLFKHRLPAFARKQRTPTDRTVPCRPGYRKRTARDSIRSYHAIPFCQTVPSVGCPLTRHSRNRTGCARTHVRGNGSPVTRRLVGHSGRRPDGRRVLGNDRVCPARVPQTQAHAA